MKQINNSNWKKFHLYDLFDIDPGTKFDKIKMKTDNPSVNFVGRSNVNNGVTCFVNEVEGVEPFSSGYMTLALGGAYLGSCFIQKKPFYTSQNVVVLIPKFSMSFEVKQFISSAIFKESQNNYKAFIKELNAHIKKDFVIMLPVKPDKTIDTDYMEKTIKTFREKTINKIEIFKNLEFTKKSFVDIKSWKSFKMTDLFTVTGTTTTPKNKLELYEGGLYPYATTAGTNNGVSGFSDVFTEKGGVLTIDSAVLGTCFYQKNDFTASDHVEKLIPKFNMDKEIALFLVTVINAEGRRLDYAYNEKRSQTVLKKESLLLPADSNGEPDWIFMRNFIQQISEKVVSNYSVLVTNLK